MDCLVVGVWFGKQKCATRDHETGVAMSRLTATCRCRPCDRPRLRRTSHGLHRQPCGSHRRAGHENGPEARHEKFTNRWNARCAIQRLCHLAEGSCSSAGACSCATKVAFRVSVRCRKPLGLRRRAVRDEGRRTSGRRAARRAGGAKHLPATQPSFRGRAPAPSSRRCFNVQLSKIKTPKGLGIPRAKRVRAAAARAGVRVPTRFPLAVAPDAGDHMPPRL